MTQGRPINSQTPIPWSRIKARYESDPSATPYRLSREFSLDLVHPRPTRQGIEYRIRTRGWRKKPELIDLAKTAKNVTKPGPTTHMAHRDPALYAFLVETYGKSGNYTLTAKLAGLDRNTLARWRRKDEQLQRAMDQARARELTALAGTIHDSAKVDWKAAAYILERAPQTRADYGKDAGKGGDVTVVLAIPRGPVDWGGEW